MAHIVDVINTEELQYGECCCCLEKGDHRELTKLYYLDKRPEIYEVLFKDAFDIVLKYPETTKLICDICIVELRQARHFRSMVESTQQRLSDRINWQPEFHDVKDEPSPVMDVIKQESNKEMEGPVNQAEEPVLQTEWSECMFEVSNNGIQGTYKRLEELLTEEQLIVQRLESVKEEPAHTLNIECIKQEPDDQMEEVYAAYQDSRKRSDFAITRHKLKTLKVRLTRDPAVEQLFSKTQTKREKTQKRRKKIHSCEICPYIATTRGNLVRHMNIHAGKKMYHCDLCSYNTGRREHMVTHLHTHVGVRPFSCGICQFRSTTSINLKDHMRTHTGEKPFSCKLCKFRTARKCNLKDHMRSHTGEKPFSCEFCDYRGNMKSKLRQHVRNCHLEEKPSSSDISVKKEPNRDFEIVLL